jgi:hypothetical protein
LGLSGCRYLTWRQPLKSENAMHAEQHDNQGAQETDAGKLCD